MSTYVSKVTNAIPRLATRTAGIQNKTIRSSLFPSRLAEKSNAKKKTARTQNSGESKLSTKPAPTAASSAAFCSLIP